MARILRKKSKSTPHPGLWNKTQAQYFEVDGYVSSSWPSVVEELPLKTLKIYNTEGCRATQTVTFPPNKDGVSKPPLLSYPAASASNVLPAYSASMYGWNSRLYAGVYSKFTAAAKQGSSQWGMNVVQGRKALSTLIQLATTSATLLAAFAKKYQVGIQALKSRRHSKLRTVIAQREATDRALRKARTNADRVRLSNEIWTLDQITKTLLAYRYGVEPVMKDIYQTCQTLSEPFKDNVTLKKGGSHPWNGPASSSTSPWTGTETVTLKATVSVSNPNLALANRLGVSNPQYWIWDAMPWSFMIDWWLPVGAMLENLTATVGFSLIDSSVTRTITYSGSWNIQKQVEDYNKLYSPNQATMSVVYNGGCTLFGKRKQRTLGSLPVPLSVPYGTGLGIQRGQNALALCVQLLKGKIPK